MDDKVYLKKEIKADKPFENHPNAIFGIFIVLYSGWFLASIFLFESIAIGMGVNVLLGVLLFWWIFKKNEKANLSKSDAFIVRDSRLYYIRLGYHLDKEVPVEMTNVFLAGMDNAINISRARENMAKTRMIQSIRTQEEIYSKLLTTILMTPETVLDDGNRGRRLPNFVIQFCEMDHPKLEKQKKDWIWLSWENAYTNGKRVSGKFRNAFDLSMLSEVD